MEHPKGANASVPKQGVQDAAQGQLNWCSVGRQRGLDRCEEHMGR